MHAVTVMPIANGASRPAAPRTGVCSTVLTRKKSADRFERESAP